MGVIACATMFGLHGSRDPASGVCGLSTAAMVRAEVCKCNRRGPARGAVPEAAGIRNVGLLGRIARGAAHHFGKVRLLQKGQGLMGEVVLFHHAPGRTPGFLPFADELRRAGHTVHTPDLFDGRVFRSIEDGVAHADSVGFEVIMQRGVEAADAAGRLGLRGLLFGRAARTRAGAGGASMLDRLVPDLDGRREHTGDLQRAFRYAHPIISSD